MAAIAREKKKGRWTGGGPVGEVAAGSPAKRAGIRKGDRIIRLNGFHLSDVIDYQFHLEPGIQELDLEREGERFTVEMDLGSGDEPGIVFCQTLFDGIRRCRCDCPFCFEGQLPKGLRRPVYIRDDDYRLSFLHGNFTTLNNLTGDDLRRIVEQRLSPLYVSLHAIDPQVRSRLMGCSPAAAAAGIENLRQLDREGVAAHIQIVLCPGINDGERLEETVAELADGFGNIGSVGVVPVALDPGLARTHGAAAGAGKGGGERKLPLRPPEREECEEVARRIGRWHDGFRRSRGRGFVYAADEFFLRAGLQLPGLTYYDDMAQFENGIGIGATFLDEADGIPVQLAQGVRRPQGRVMMVTGTLAAPLVDEVCGKLNRAGAAAAEGVPGEEPLDVVYQPLVVENRLFGPHVTVTGLLGGGDILAAARGEGLKEEEMLLIPYCCVDNSGHLFLDDLTVRQMDEALDCIVRLAPP
jgi:putative radical SAM enzyme (TIGR03279 family)